MDPLGQDTPRNLVLLLPLILLWTRTCIAGPHAWLYEHHSISEESIRVVHDESEHQTAMRLRRNAKLFPDELFPDELTFKLEGSQHRRELVLEKNALLNKVRNLYTFRGGHVVLDHMVPREINEVMYYQNWNTGAAVVVNCLATPEHRCRYYQMGGVIDLAGYQYTILPRHPNGKSSWQHTSAVSSNSSEDGRAEHEDYLLRKLDSSIDFTDDYIQHPDILNRQGNVHAPRSRVKRATIDNVVELLMILDYSVFQFWYNKTDPALTEAQREVETKELANQYYAFLINGVDMRYKSIDAADMSISVSYAGLIFATKPSDSPWTELNANQTSTNVRKPLPAETALVDFTHWVGAGGVLPPFDHVMLFTAYDLTRAGSSSSAGLANVGTICTNDGTSISENYFDFTGITVTAHELGHGLGGLHDGQGDSTCAAGLGFIMAPVSSVQSRQNNWYFSACSEYEFRTTITNLDNTNSNCLKVKGSSVDNSDIASYLVKKPGQIYSIDQQCSYALNGNSYLCRNHYSASTLASTICSRTMCAIPGNATHCTTVTLGEGSPCGDKRWCIQGSCVDDPNASPLSDTCPFGDQPGVIISGLSCSQLMTTYPWVCYTEGLRWQCCSSCDSIATEITDCLYGDTTNCIISRAHCYTVQTEKLCCGTCALLKKPENVGCEYGDRVRGCAASQCPLYAENTRVSLCCETCMETTTTTTAATIPSAPTTTPKIPPVTTSTTPPATTSTTPPTTTTTSTRTPITATTIQTTITTTPTTMTPPPPLSTTTPQPMTTTPSPVSPSLSPVPSVTSVPTTEAASRMTTTQLNSTNQSFSSTTSNILPGVNSSPVPIAAVTALYVNVVVAILCHIFVVP